MNHDQPRYISYLVRMWQVEGSRGWQWRASLESPESGERHLFPSLEHMIAYLRAQIESQGQYGNEDD